MSSFIRKTIDTSIENQLVTASIVSTPFLSKISPIYDDTYIVNDYIRTICNWSLHYFNEYGEAPNLNINSIYELEKHTLDKSEAELIAASLAKLSKEYVDGGGINEEYVFDNTLKYFDKRDLTLRIERASLLKDAGRFNEAKTVLQRQPALEKALCKWTDVFDPAFVTKVFDTNRRDLFTMPGIVGDLFGPFRRNWLVGIFGTFKKGKSWYLLEVGTQALINKLNVAFFSLEMPDEEVGERFYKRITGAGDGEELYFPMFDCYLNQTGDCDREERRNKIIIRTNGKQELIKYTKGYKSCSLCRGEDDCYKPEIYYDKIQSPVYESKLVRKTLKSFSMMYGKKFKLFCYPRFSASYDDIENDLLRLEIEEGFIPDVIVIDYANILRPGSFADRDKKTEIIDDIWKNLARISQEKHCLVVTGAQGNRSSLKKIQQEEEDVADWIGILAHVNVFAAINQTSFEKSKGVIRFNILEHRHRYFNPDRNVIVLQKLNAGQPLLDSEWDK